MERLTTKNADGTYELEKFGVIEKIPYSDDTPNNGGFLYQGKAIDKLGMYEDAEEQGLLFRPLARWEIPFGILIINILVLM